MAEATGRTAAGSSNGRGLSVLRGEARFFPPWWTRREIKDRFAALMRMKILSGYQKLEGLLATLGAWAQPVVLLAIRLYWGWGFFQTGKGKLLNLEKTTAFFAELNLPLPQLNAIAAGVVEGVGGLLLMVGLASRGVSGALMFTMGVAYATAHREELGQVFSDTDKFTEAAPFLFLLASAIVFAFGPGKISVDAWLGKKRGASAP